MRVEICGGIGAGKTSLATLLGHNNFSPIIENFKLNPFWEQFFTDPSKFGFEAEITFLLQHYHEIKITHEKPGLFVCDFSLHQDLAYAKKGLDGKRLRIFEDIFSEGIGEVNLPNLLICLKCDPDVLLERIRGRGRKEEEHIDIDFLAALNNHIYSEAKNLGETVLYIDSQKYNFVSNPTHQREILKLIKIRCDY